MITDQSLCNDAKNIFKVTFLFFAGQDFYVQHNKLCLSLIEDETIEP